MWSTSLGALLQLHAHQTESFFAWPIWGFIGTCAEVAALGTFIFAAVRWFRARRQYPPVIFEVGVPFTLSHPDGTPAGYRARVTNSGRATAHIRTIYLIGASVVTEITSPQIRWFVGSTTYFEFDVESDTINKAWMLIVSSSLEDAYLLRAAWYPLQAGNDLSFEQQKSYVRAKPRGWPMSTWQRRHPRAVGPGKDGVAMIAMRKGKLRDIPESVLEVIYELDEALMLRPGTSIGGDPKKWPKLAPE